MADLRSGACSASSFVVKAASTGFFGHTKVCLDLSFPEERRHCSPFFLCTIISVFFYVSDALLLFIAFVPYAIIWPGAIFNNLPEDAPVTNLTLNPNTSSASSRSVKDNVFVGVANISDDTV